MKKMWSTWNSLPVLGISPKSYQLVFVVEFVFEIVERPFLTTLWIVTYNWMRKCTKIP